MCACAIIAVQAAPKPGVLAYSAPVVAAPVVTATSHQVIARNYNGLAVAAPVAHTAAAPVAYTAPALAARYAYSPYSAYSAYAPYSPYVAGPAFL